jgi:hypothetical protein
MQALHHEWSETYESARVFVVATVLKEAPRLGEAPRPFNGVAMAEAARSAVAARKDFMVRLMVVKRKGAKKVGGGKEEELERGRKKEYVHVGFIHREFICNGHVVAAMRCVALSLASKRAQARRASWLDCGRTARSSGGRP